ncbi:MAG: pyridoxal-phosphate-dependent aminotransferase family protein [Candidatus Helarchaeales archaeon]
MMKVDTSKLLMVPGPVPLHERVLKALCTPIIGHRTPEFYALLDECISMFQQLLDTKEFVRIFTGSSTCAMEAAIVNCVRPGEKVLNVVQGKFSERWREITEAMRAQSVVLDVEWGKALRLEQIKEVLEEQPDIKHVTVVHNETSVGVLNDLRGLGKYCRDNDKFLIVDGVTSVGGDHVYPDAWNFDLLATGSQKCIGIPPGLGMIWLGPRAWNIIKERDHVPAYYLNLKRYENEKIPYTPSVSLFYALHESLTMMIEEGFENRFKRHALMGKAVRAGIQALGMELFAEPDYYSNTVTAIKIPNGLEAKKLLQKVKEHGVILAGGQGKVKGKIFRIAHMNMVSKNDILQTFEALEKALMDLKFDFEKGAGIEAVQSVFSKE